MAIQYKKSLKISKGGNHNP